MIVSVHLALLPDNAINHMNPTRDTESKLCLLEFNVTLGLLFHRSDTEPLAVPISWRLCELSPVAFKR